MTTWLWFSMMLTSVLATTIVLFVSRRKWTSDVKKSPGITVTGLASIGLFCAIAAWLSTDKSIGKIDILKAGGIGAASVVGLYGIWLNDRRRRTEENRNELEGKRTELDRQRVAEEGFARAIQLLGDTEHRTRIGGLHSLSGISAIHPARTQSVADVICSYLRQPIGPTKSATENAASTVQPEAEGETKEKSPLRQAAHDRSSPEEEVRWVANRVLTDTLEGHIGPINIDLEGADLKDFMLRDCTTNRLRLRGAELRHSPETGPEFTLNGVHLQRAADFTKVRFRAEVVQFKNCTFHEGAVFRRSILAGRTTFINSNFQGDLDFSQATLDGQVYLDFATLKNFADVWFISEGLTLTDGVSVDLGGPKGRRILVPNKWSIDRRDEKEILILNHY